MAAIAGDSRDVEVANAKLWADGPPYELFRELRGRCPVHWSERIEQYPQESGFWSVTTADDVHEVSRDWETYSSHLGGVTVVAEIFRLELVRGMFVGTALARHEQTRARLPGGGGVQGDGRMGV